MSLLATIDRLSTAASAINKVAKSAAKQSEPGPFYRALVTRDIQSVIRDVDETELGLFTLPSLQVGSTGSTEQASSKIPELETNTIVNVDRVNVVEATPLRERKRRVRSRDAEEYDPEVYAEAALRLLAK
jgi:hypothetical protein